MQNHHLNLKLSGGIHASADVPLTPAIIQAIKSCPDTAARFAARTALTALAECNRNNPSWPQSSKESVSVDIAACTLACVLEMPQ